ncbi:nicotinate-nicotinamide nucleotide adenylyltransferase [uncultured Psychrobacter sp.]|uniref:nicotinate-nicotinamide nucleotide adenylyltransferase n=1 Tax=uncultured Psychrobacter sp. TaxID=259303 RepID=UPI002623EDED|nr:nicotinate-nicotinamide nucleotide adenylyltransferase [uncultured Psychrobacter sp.]
MTKPFPTAIRAYLGGSFNPVHSAHIEMAMQVYHSLAPLTAERNCELQVSLLPNARSPFKSQSLAPKHRLAMLQLAVQDTPIRVDELEIWQPPPVYTIDSVRTLRQRYLQDVLIFIMGMDSARSLDKWKQGLQLTDYVHLWIFGRSASADPNLPHKPFDNNKTLSDKQRALLINELPNSLPAQVVDSISELVTTSIDSLAAQNLANKGLKTLPKGRIYIDSRPVQKVSSTKIRTQLLTDCTAPIIKDSLLNHCEYLSKHLHPAVYNYIVQHKLYSAD